MGQGSELGRVKVRGWVRGEGEGEGQVGLPPGDINHAHSTAMGVR